MPTAQRTAVSKRFPKEGVGHFQHEILERDDKIRYLSEEVDAEKRERLDAQEHARSDRLVVESLKAELDEEQLAHQKLREESIQATLEAEQVHAFSCTKIESLRVRLAFLESEAHRVEVMEQYRDSPLGKVEVALACKASFDYLLEQIPRESRPGPDHLYYPSRVASCLDALKEMERKEGRLVLDVDIGDEGGEESEGGSGGDMWVSRPVDDKDEEVVTASPWLTPALEPSAALPNPTPDPSRAP